MGELRIMDPEKGDAMLEWDPEDHEQVAKAREAFDTAKSHKNMLLYEVTKDGAEGKPMKTFDPNVERIIGMPFPVGG